MKASQIGPLKLAIEGVQTYWPAIISMQICAGLSVVAYYNLEPVRAFAERLAEWRQAGGLVFAAVSMIIIGGLLPELLKWRLRPPGRRGPTLVELVHQCGYFAISGMLVDRFYAVQEKLLGTGSEWWRVLAKILVDQFAFSLFIATPFVVAWFSWREQRFSMVRTLKGLRLPLFLERVPPLFIPNLCYWLPALIALYLLPINLQFLLFVFLAAGWSILLVFIARRQTESSVRSLGNPS